MVTCMHKILAVRIFYEVYPMGAKSDTACMLDKFVRTYKAPKQYIFDGSKEQCGKDSKFQQIIRKYEISYHITEPEHPNQNSTEDVIRELKCKCLQVMYKTNCPARLRDYRMSHVAAIINWTTSTSANLDKRIPLELITE